jgi:teichuronic acid biosynthesis glycosyltransferase TuaG
MSSLVSIVTPCYNAERVISYTIESVLAQSYQNWELLIVDDCSTDKTAEIIAKYCKQDSRIKYLKTNESSGSPSLPRNIGLENAKGRYIAFLDSDDLWLPDKLKEQVEFMQNHGYRFVYSNYEKINYSGERNNRVIKGKETVTYWDTLCSCDIPCLTVIMDRDIIGDTRFKSICKEDYAFWLEILRKGIRAYNTNANHALYRETPNSRSSNKWAMIKNQWYVLTQVEGVLTPIALYFMIPFLFKGFSKYIK